MIGRALVLVMMVAGLVVVGTVPAHAAPTFKAPFQCGTVWGASTYPGHGNAADMNMSNTADGDHGKPVLASAGGTATHGFSRINGNYVVVSHGSGWSTYYGHLDSVVIDNPIVTGEKIGTVGQTGSATGDHVHYEQRYGGDGVLPIKFDGEAIEIGSSPPGPTFRSTNCPAPTGSFDATSPAPGFVKVTGNASQPGSTKDVTITVYAGGKKGVGTRILSFKDRGTFTRTAGTTAYGRVPLYVYVSSAYGTTALAPKAAYVIAKQGGQSATSDGYMFTTFVGSDGGLHYVARGDADNTWRSWGGRGSPVGVTLVGRPYAVHADGYLFVFVRGLDGAIHYVARNAGGDTWNAWQTWVPPTGVQFVSDPQAAVSDGYLFLVALGDNGHVYTKARPENGSPWLSWQDRGTPADAQLSGTPSAAVSGGYLFLLGVTADGRLVSRARSESENAWRAWTDRGAPTGTTVLATPSATTVDGYLFVAVVDENGNVYTRARQVGGDWLGWQDRGSPGVALQGSPATAVSDGYLFVGAIGEDGRLYTRARNSSANSWNEWYPRNNPGVALAGSPAMTTSDGAMFLHATATDGHLYSRARYESSNVTGDWRAGGAPVGVTLAW